VPPTSPLTWHDHAVLFAALALVLGIGAGFGRRQKDTKDFFLARRQVPWWAACLSFLATEISALTIIGVPATAYSENWEYLQFFLGSSAAKLAIAALFVPAFFKLQVTTIYELLLHRFGRRTQVTASIFFFITRLLGSAVRLMAAALAVSILLGWPIPLTILVFTLVSIAYIASGGVQAIVWTNVVQAVVFMGAGLAALAYVTAQVDGGVGGVIAAAEAGGRLRVFDWGPGLGEAGFVRRWLTEPNIVWVALLNGFVGSLAAFGTDHDLMQRLLAVESRGESQRTLLLSPIITFVALMTFLCLGAALYAYYAAHPGAPAKADTVLATFVADVMPAGLRGLVLTAIVLASLDSPLGALAASFVTDIYRPLIAPARDDAHHLRVSRLSVLAFGVVLGLLAWAFAHLEKILWLAFKITGVTFGSLLGVFLLALLTERRIRDRANVVAMIAMALVNLTLLVLSETGVLAFAWSWLVILGTAGTMALALGIDVVTGAAPSPPPADSGASPTP
jgi:solute:Na+ symporter, SSS family